MSQFLSNCTADAMLGAAAHLKAGDLVAFPTETVYGLGADASNSKAVARIYSVKGRHSDHPLIVHVASMDRRGDWASEVPEYAIKLARDFWPGPMTLVLKRSELAGDFITGGQDTVGVRVPDHVVALALLEAFEKVGGKGVAAPSANRFGHVSTTTAAAVVEELGDYLSQDDLVLDGGECAVGVESTIIDCTCAAPSVLRPGAISVAMIEECTGSKTTQSDKEIRVSGSLENHYAPSAKVLLCEVPIAGQGFIALAAIETPEGVIRLAAPHDDEEFAHLLYSALRDADTQGLAEVVVIQPIGIGIAVAIRDRLARAANGR
ncbi:MAG: L-threonylcarbamoyladenylate synthase [Actinobacteria bacterium]|nr:L-threonylcarbamoyladenylate synthase [Actinomycetota bacterium]